MPDAAGSTVEAVTEVSAFVGSAALDRLGEWAALNRRFCIHCY